MLMWIMLKFAVYQLAQQLRVVVVTPLREILRFPEVRYWFAMDLDGVQTVSPSETTHRARLRLLCMAMSTKEVVVKPVNYLLTGMKLRSPGWAADQKMSVVVER